MTEPKFAVARRLPSGRPVRPAVIRGIQCQLAPYDKAIEEMHKLEEDVEELKSSSKEPAVTAKEK